MLPGDTDALVLAGFQEGVLTAPESGWLSDRERRNLEEGTGKEIGISRERRGWIRRYDICRTGAVSRCMSTGSYPDCGQSFRESGRRAA